MLRDDDPFAVALLDDAGPAGVLPGGRLAFVGVDVVKDAVEPGHRAAAGQLDLQVLEFVPDVSEIRAFCLTSSKRLMTRGPGVTLM